MRGEVQLEVGTARRSTGAWRCSRARPDATPCLNLSTRSGGRRDLARGTFAGTKEAIRSAITGVGLRRAKPPRNSQGQGTPAGCAVRVPVTEVLLVLSHRSVLPLAAVTCLSIFLALALTLPEGATLSSTQRAVLIIPATAAPAPLQGTCGARPDRPRRRSGRPRGNERYDAAAVHPSARSPRTRARPSARSSGRASHPRDAKEHAAKRPVRRHGGAAPCGTPRSTSCGRQERVVRHAKKRVVRARQEARRAARKKHVRPHRVARPGHVVPATPAHAQRRATRPPSDVAARRRGRNAQPGGGLAPGAARHRRAVAARRVPVAGEPLPQLGDLTAAGYPRTSVATTPPERRARPGVVASLGTNNDLYTTAHWAGCGRRRSSIRCGAWQALQGHHHRRCR